MILSLVSFSPVFAAEDFYVLQLVKNVTTGDDPSGEKYTMASPDHEMRHLVVVRNTSDTPREFEIGLQLPRFLDLETGSTEKLDGAAGWDTATDLTTPRTLTLDGKQSFVVRFTTNVNEKFPNENSVLTTVVSARETATDETEAAATKIYVANFVPTAEPIAEIAELPASERERVEAALAEEREYIEEQFEASLAEPANDETAEKSEEKTETNFVFWLLLVSVAAVIIFLISLKNVRKKN